MKTPGPAGIKTPGPADGTRRMDRVRSSGQDADGDADSAGMLGCGATLGAASLGWTVAAGLDPPAGVQAMRAAPRARERSKRVNMGKSS